MRGWYIMMSFRGIIVLSSACRHVANLQMNSLRLVNSAAESNSYLHTYSIISGYSQIRWLSMKYTDPIDAADIAKVAPKKERAKTSETPKITLLDLKDDISVCTMQEAEKIANSENLRLVQVIDAKLRTQRPTYKLMSEADYLAEELREKQKIKEEKKKKNIFVKGNKLMTITSRTSEHDVETKVKKSLKWLKKNYEIRVIILGSEANTAPQEEIYKKFEKAFKDIGRIVQKRIKNGDLRFQIIPPKREDSASKGNESEAEQESKVTEKAEVSEEKLEAVKESLSGNI